MDLLEQHHRNGRRFEPVDVVAEGERVAFELPGGVWKVASFRGDEIVLLQDCLDRADALGRLGRR